MASEIAILGLGKMGHALADAFAGAGRRTLGWNRSPTRQDGARYRFEPDIARCCSRADILVMVPSDYAAATEIFERITKAGVAAGKLIVNASSGSPEEAEAFARLIQGAGAIPIDCAIMGYPGDVGTERVYMLYAGSHEAFEHVRANFAALGPHQVLVGSNPGAAKAIDCGLLMRSYNWMFGYFQALILMRSLGVDEQRFGELTAAIIGPLQHNILRTTRAISEGSFGAAEHASIDVHRAALSKVVDLARAKGLNLSIPEICLKAFEDAIADGMGQADIAGAFPSFASRAAVQISDPS